MIQVGLFWGVSINGRAPTEDDTYEYECNARAAARWAIKRALESL